MTPFEQISKFRQHFKDPSLQIFTDSSWSSQNDNFRLSVRAAVLMKLCELKDTAPDAEILDLSHPPKAHQHKISISHCPDMGGFAISNKNIGWDIEQISRVKDEVVHRIIRSSNSEKPPYPAALWSAQEASFKCFSPLTSLTHFTEIRVSNWESLSANEHVFKTQAGEKFFGHGLVISTPDHVYALTVALA